MVGFGNRSVDEMSFSWMNAYQMTYEEFQNEISARVKMKTTSTNNNQD
jgi:hypothetical protein